MTAPVDLDYLATVNWLKRCDVGELAPDSPTTTLLVGRWRLRKGGSRLRAFLTFYVPALVVAFGSKLLAEQLGMHVGELYPTPVIAMTLSVGLELWFIRRRESVLASRWTARVGRATAGTVGSLLERTVLRALALVALVQMAAVVDVASRRGVALAAAMLALTLLCWAVAVFGVGEAATRPMVAIDETSRTVDEWLRRQDAQSASAVGVVGSLVLMFFGDVPTGLTLALGAVSAAVLWGIGTQAGRAWFSKHDDDGSRSS